MSLTAGDRRSFLKKSAFAGGAILGFGAFDGLIARVAHGQTVDPTNGGYGPLRSLTRQCQDVPSVSQTLELPEAFDFEVFGLAGTTLADGSRTPLGHDGMGCLIGPDGGDRLIRNHEDRNGTGVAPSGTSNAHRYNPTGGGGTTSLDIGRDADGVPQLGRVFTSLAGTIVNCAGGITPWNSWVSCEETTATRSGVNHGYAFEVSAEAEETVDPVPITAAGRRSHEACAVDPRTGYLYMTEDIGNAGLYRYIPDTPGDLAGGGSLWMLRVVGRNGLNTATNQRQGRPMRVDWVPIANPATNNYGQGSGQGGARFARLEGCWWGRGALYFASTNGGNAGQGQIWELRPASDTSGTLTLVYESPGASTLSNPDNLCVTPNDALLLCEDTSQNPFGMLGLTRDGTIFPFARSSTGGEWAGACFSPDGTILYANLQYATSGGLPSPGGQGRTVAIYGPWDEGVL